MMLDDMNVIAQRDKSDALGLAYETPEQLTHLFGLERQTPKAEIKNLVLVGMGGSALQVEFLRIWPELKLPFVIVKDYDVPAFTNENTLCIVASYSGNTEETLEALGHARDKGATIAIMAGGGKLEEMQDKDEVFMRIPKAVQPRMVAFYAYRMLLELLVAYDLIDDSVFEQLEKTERSLHEAVQSWKKDVPTAENPAKQVALQLVGKTPIVYAGPLMAPAAYKWKISFNESSKNTSWMGVLSEFNHNEFMGWTSHPIEKPFGVIDLTSSFEHPRILRRFEVGDRMLSGKRPKAITVEAQGDHPLTHLLYLVLFGDFVSLYLGILNGVDPSPVDLIEKFKKELG